MEVRINTPTVLPTDWPHSPLCPHPHTESPHITFFCTNNNLYRTSIEELHTEMYSIFIIYFAEVFGR